jgi:hypothetical protein
MQRINWVCSDYLRDLNILGSCSCQVSNLGHVSRSQSLHLKRNAACFIVALLMILSQLTKIISIYPDFVLFFPLFPPSLIKIGSAHKLDWLSFVGFRFSSCSSSLPSFPSCSSFLGKDFLQPRNQFRLQNFNFSGGRLSFQQAFPSRCLSSFPPPPSGSASVHEWTFHFGIRLIIVLYCP